MVANNKNTHVSVAIELDNAAFHAESAWMESLNLMLEWVSQSTEINVTEVFITHCDEYSSSVDGYIGQIPNPWKGRVKSLSFKKEDTHYYVMKNEAAKRASGEIIVFLDCDLRPTGGAFGSLVEPLFKKSQVASCGHTYFPLKDFMSKSYSLFWFFPLHARAETLGKNQLHASNVAFDKKWFLKTGFEMQYGGFKVSCFLISQRLKDEGYVISHPDVWFEHELWNHSLRFFIWRAAVAGRDHDKKFAIRHSMKRWPRLKAAGRSLAYDIKRVYVKHIKYYRDVKLTPTTATLSFLFSCCFFFLLRLNQAKSGLTPLRKNMEVVPRNFIT